jgi:hypothetical protein
MLIIIDFFIRMLFGVAYCKQFQEIQFLISRNNFVFVVITLISFHFFIISLSRRTALVIFSPSVIIGKHIKMETRVY